MHIIRPIYIALIPTIALYAITGSSKHIGLFGTYLQWFTKQKLTVCDH